DAAKSTAPKSTKPKKPTKQTASTTPRAHASRPRKTTGRRARVPSRAADYSSSAQGGVPPSEPTPPTVFVAEVVDEVVDEVVEETPTPTKRMRRPPVTRARATIVETATTTETVQVDVGPSGGLRVLMIASEAVPFAKTGGLADVAGALPIALGRLGHDVT